MLREGVEWIARELPGHDLAIGVDGVVQLGVDDVDSRPTDSGVLGAVGMERDAVRACLPEDRVAAGAAVQEVPAGSSVDPVVPAAAADGVGQLVPTRRSARSVPVSSAARATPNAASAMSAPSAGTETAARTDILGSVEHGQEPGRRSPGLSHFMWGAPAQACEVSGTAR